MVIFNLDTTSLGITNIKNRELALIHTALMRICFPLYMNVNACSTISYRYFKYYLCDYIVIHLYNILELQWILSKLCAFIKKK